MNLFSFQSSKQKILYTIVFLLSLIGIGVAAYLIYIHLKPAGTGTFCNIDDYWNCDRVNNSLYAYLFDIPVSYFGAAFYVFSGLVWLILLLQVNIAKILGSKIRWLLGLTAVAGALGSLALIVYEVTIPGNLIPWVIVRGLLFIAAFVWIFLKYRKYSNLRSVFLAFLLLCSLFGVNFSLYLTDMEFFVLEAICVLCLTQQIVILLITFCTVESLKLSDQYGSEIPGKSGSQA